MLERAIRELPGNALLMEAEASYLAGGPLSIDLQAIIHGLSKPEGGRSSASR
jgi:hypothetical protein